MIEFLKQTFGDAVTDEIITNFKSELGKKFVAKADYNTKRDELKNMQTEFDEFKMQAESIQARADEADRLNEELSALQIKYDEHVSVLNGKLEQMQLENDIGALIRRSGGKNEKAVRALLNLSDDNPMENAAQQLDLLKSSDPYLFDMPTPAGTKGNFPRNDAVQTGTLTYSQMMQLEANRNNL